MAWVLFEHSFNLSSCVAGAPFAGQGRLTRHRNVNRGRHQDLGIAQIRIVRGTAVVGDGSGGPVTVLVDVVDHLPDRHVHPRLRGVHGPDRLDSLHRQFVIAGQP